MKTETLIKVANMTARRHNLTIIFGDYRPKTNGRSIYLPALSADDPDTKIYLAGYLDHEAGHCGQTDFDCQQPKLPFINTLFQCIEDARMERAHGEHYPGVRKNLDRLVTTLANQDQPFDFFRSMTEEDNYTTMIAAKVLQRGRAGLAQSAMIDLSTQTDAVCASIFPAELMATIERITDSIPNMRTTQCAIDAAHSIADEISLFDPPATQTDEKEGRGNPDPTSDLKRDIQKPDLDIPHGDLGSMTGTILEKNADNSSGIVGAFGTCDAVLHPGIAPINYDRATALGRSASQKLRKAFETNTRSSEYHTRSGRRIDRRRLVTIGMPNAKPFMRRTHERTNRTAVSVLLDTSESMRDRGRIYTAGEATYALLYALRSISGIHASAHSFAASRAQPLTRLTDFGESLEASKGRYVTKPSGGTPLREALWSAAGPLLSQKSSRRMLLVLTDGRIPDHRCVETIDALNRTGIETIGVGIGVDISHVFGHRSIAVHQIEELANKLFVITSQHLQKEVAA